MNQAPYYIGIDLGGTQLRMAAVTGSGQLATELLSVPTGKEFAPTDLLRALRPLAARVAELIGDHPIAGWGVGAAGVVWNGQLSQSDNVPLLSDIDLADLLNEATCGLPVKLENDARCFVLAEARFGAGRGARNVCGITLGTGCGGGVIVDGKLVRGTHGAAGEVWAIPLREQFLEYYVSGYGLLRTYQEHGGAIGDGLTGAELAARARHGEAAALATWRAYGDDVYFLCETLIALLEPEIIVIGGSMAQAHDLFGEKFQHKLANRPTRLALAELGAGAGVIGAAALHL
ncbi:MAG: ROK family protein [Acidobacteria bacterium]|nr:ROK family protein [Acidobacteriota bacterium]MBI3426589.1 ROK family protein [Acidobacteriota bacterium]